MIDNLTLRVKTESRSALLKMATEICLTSNCLSVLTLRDTNTTYDDGAYFLKALRDSDLVTLKQIDLSGGYNYQSGFFEHAWFNECQDSVDTLI